MGFKYLSLYLEGETFLQQKGDTSFQHSNFSGYDTISLN